MKFILFLLLPALVGVSSLYSQNKDSLVIDYCYINSVPQNANVYLNDILIGETPVRFFPSALDTTKTNDIKITLGGYYDYRLKIEKGTASFNKTVYLVAKPGDIKAVENRQALVNSQSYFRTPRMVIPIVTAAALTAASGIMSYYFKQLSNDKYDEYQINPDQSLLDKKRKYDIISGISLAVFQVALAGLVYFLIIE